jgi:hypothetical protein
MDDAVAHVIDTLVPALDVRAVLVSGTTANDVVLWIRRRYPGVCIRVVGEWVAGPSVPGVAASSLRQFLPEAIAAPSAGECPLSRLQFPSSVLSIVASDGDGLPRTLDRALEHFVGGGSARILTLTARDPKPLDGCVKQKPHEVCMLYSIAGSSWSLFDKAVALEAHANATFAWELSQPEPVSGRAPGGALEPLEEFVLPGVLERLNELVPPVALLSHASPRRGACLQQGEGWNALSLTSEGMLSVNGAVLECGVAAVDSEGEVRLRPRLEQTHWWQLSDGALPLNRDNAPSPIPWPEPLPARVDVERLAGVDHPLSRVASPAMRVAWERLRRLQSPSNCSTARLLVVSLPQEGKPSEVALTLASALALASLLNRTLVEPPRSLPGGEWVEAPATHCGAERWGCFFEPLSPCVLPSSSISIARVPFAALRPHNESSGSGYAMLASDVIDERVVALDPLDLRELATWPSHRREGFRAAHAWVRYALSQEAVAPWLCDGSEQCPSSDTGLIWRSALVTHIWRPLQWVVRAEKDTPPAHRSTVGAWIHGADDSDQDRGVKNAVRFASRVHSQWLHRQTFLITASSDPRVDAAAVLESSWVEGVTAFSKDGAAAGPVREIQQVTALSVAGHHVADHEWSPPRDVAAALSQLVCSLERPPKVWWLVDAGGMGLASSWLQGAF